MRKKYQKWLGLAAVFALLLSAALSLTSSAFYYSGYVNSFLGITGETIEVSGETNYYLSAYGPLNAENADRLIADERDHKGINITDSSKDASDYVLTAECITSGTDLFLSDTGRTSELTNLAIKDRDGSILNWMKTANEHFYYAHSRSILINGLAEETVVHETVYWWQPALIAVCSAFGLLTAASLGMFAWKAYVKKEGR